MNQRFCSTQCVCVRVCVWGGGGGGVMIVSAVSSQRVGYQGAAKRKWWTDSSLLAPSQRASIMHAPPAPASALEEPAVSAHTAQMLKGAEGRRFGAMIATVSWLGLGLGLGSGLQ